MNFEFILVEKLFFEKKSVAENLLKCILVKIFLKTEEFFWKKMVVVGGGGSKTQILVFKFLKSNEIGKFLW